MPYEVSQPRITIFIISHISRKLKIKDRSILDKILLMPSTFDVSAEKQEELAGNIIKHGFSHDKKRHSIDVRVVKNADDYIVRIRDDCPIFDPVKQLKLYSDEDRMSHFGLRMVKTPGL